MSALQRPAALRGAAARTNGGEGSVDAAALLAAPAFAQEMRGFTTAFRDAYWATADAHLSSTTHPMY